MANDPNSADPLHLAIAATTTALVSQNVSYALIGGLATSYRSQPRFRGGNPDLRQGRDRGLMNLPEVPVRYRVLAPAREFRSATGRVRPVLRWFTSIRQPCRSGAGRLTEQKKSTIQ
jgi:hypothetical protein